MKILIIPSQQAKYADKLSVMFIQIYQLLQKSLKKDFYTDIDALLEAHLETAFKLTQHHIRAIQVRAWQWLWAMVEVSRDEMLAEMKKRMMKSVFTRAIEMLSLEHDSIKDEPLRMNALKITAKF